MSGDCAEAKGLDGRGLLGRRVEANHVPALMAEARASLLRKQGHDSKEPSEDVEDLRERLRDPDDTAGDDRALCGHWRRGRQ